MDMKILIVAVTPQSDWTFGNSENFAEIAANNNCIAGDGELARGLQREFARVEARD